MNKNSLTHIVINIQKKVKGITQVRRNAITSDNRIDRNLYIKDRSYYIIDLESSDSSSSLTPSTKFRRNLGIINDLGFISNSTNRPYIIQGEEPNKRYPTIGITDFWTFQNKLKFLKEHGFWSVYKKLLYQKNISQYTFKKNNRNPNSPYLMDFSAKRRAEPLKNNQRSISPIIQGNSYKLSRTCQQNSNKSSPTFKKLDNIANNCNTLLSQTQRLKMSAALNQDEFFQNLTRKNEPFKIKSKISKIDLKRIKRNLEAFPV